jgi:type IV pilus assembly protein PilB
MLDSSQFVIRALLEDGRIRPEDFERAREASASKGITPDEALVRLNICTPRDIAIARARVCEYPFVELDALTVEPANCRLVPRKLAERAAVFPLFVAEGTATVAMEDPLNLQTIDQLTQTLGCQIDPVLCDAEKLRSLIGKAYALARAEGYEGDSEEERELTTGEEPIVVLVNQILFSGLDAGASDIHINPDEKQLLLRFRIDGVLVGQAAPDMGSHASIVQRLKVMARLDLTQTRRPQDGKFRVRHRDKDYDVRLSLLPTIHGENVVMRLLRPAGQLGPVSSLGMPERVRRDFEEMIEKPHGIILVTGPTGSGKTTTLYTALNQINTPDVNIITVEDPVEVRLHTIRQVQANAEIGFTFASALRSILRQDPDVILVGEIRDEETARIAVQAALTGHLVFSTLHTNQAIGAIARLKDMGLPAFAINNALLGVMAQRLVRKVCEGCAELRAPSVDELHALRTSAAPGDRWSVGRGCPRCGNTGYRGRMGVYELLRVSPEIKALIEQDGVEVEIERAAREGGMMSMLDDGIAKARLGLTTVAELAKLNSMLSEDATPASSGAGVPGPSVQGADGAVPTSAGGASRAA